MPDHSNGATRSETSQPTPDQRENTQQPELPTAGKFSRRDGSFFTHVVGIMMSVAGLLLAWQANTLIRTQNKLIESQDLLSQAQLKYLTHQERPKLSLQIVEENYITGGHSYWIVLSNEGRDARNVTIRYRSMLAVLYKKDNSYGNFKMPLFGWSDPGPIDIFAEHAKIGIVNVASFPTEPQLEQWEAFMKESIV